MLISFIIKHPVVWGKPYTIFIEPTGFCNLKCPECVVGSAMLNRPKGNMSFPEFKRLIDEVKDHVFMLFLYFQGEPFINKEIHKMITYAAAQNIFIITSTNGHFFNTDEKAQKAVESGIHYIIVSMDGATEESYTKYRRGGNLDIVLEGIKRIIDYRKTIKSKYPQVAIQFLVMKENETEIPLLNTMAENLGVDSVLLKSLQVYHTEEMESLLPTNEKYRRYEFKDGKWQLKGKYYNFCTKLWVGSVISWESKMFPCCFDKDGDHLNADLTNGSFAEIWKGRELQSFRKQVLTDRQQIDICRNCSEGQKIFHIL